jgi:hypothetical protein
MKKMKIHQFAKLAILICGFMAFTVFTPSCEKDHQPTIYGQWETVQAFGYKWEYKIPKHGQLCRKLPEAFGETSFCFDYEIEGDVMSINAPVIEVWKITFICENVAEITVTYPDSSITNLILKRI